MSTHLPPKVLNFVHWANAGFTIGTITFDFDFLLKIAALLLVTVPLGAIQWWNLYDKWKERRAKKNGQ